MSGPAWVWLNGELIPYDHAKLHVASTVIHFGPTAFEGIRCYRWSCGRSAFFRLGDHIERLLRSARAVHLEVPFTGAEITRACVDTVLANRHTDAYVRPLVFPGSDSLGFGRPGRHAEVCVLSFPWRDAPLEKSQQRGIRVHVSSVIRTSASPTLSASKVSANYAAGLLAVHEARGAGCDDAILLDGAGAVAEGSTSNVFAVFGEDLATPPTNLPILAGITRDTLLVLARELGIRVAERTFGPEELAVADEVFLSGTTSEVMPVREIDGRDVGAGVPGPMTRTLSGALRGAIRGDRPSRQWSHSVPRGI
jgi:branched-chain amino acid aminotransferase